MPAGLHSPAGSLNQINAEKGIPDDSFRWADALESALSDLANAYSKAPDKAKELAFIEQDSDLEPLRETVAYGRWRASLPISQ